MNFKQIPIIATPITLKELLKALNALFIKPSLQNIFEDNLRVYFGCRFCHLTYSGRAAVYLILRVLSGLKDKKEVIIPAYFSASVTAAVKKAGLKVKPCDISLDTFQMDINALEKEISDDTLCVIPAHLFGLACDIERINRLGSERGVFVVEDFAQSMGTTIDNKESGTFSEISFSSFARGKNLPTYSGGIILTGNQNISDKLKEKIRLLPSPSVAQKANTLMNLIIFSLLINPYIHRAFHKLIILLKGEDRPVFDLEALRYTDFQSSVGNYILGKFNLYRDKRLKNGMFLYRELKGFDFIKLPAILNNSRPAFNRFPLLFKEKSLREKAEKELLKKGIIACRLYTKPQHRLYDDIWDGKGADPYPNASIFSENSLTLPTHPLMDERALYTIVEVFKRI